MQLSRSKFEEVKKNLDNGAGIAASALSSRISERQVQRIKEAGTWDRWPYIVAKATHGYNTPEYKQYLKRRGLPLTIPPKHHGDATKVNVPQPWVAPVEKPKRSLLDRILRRK